MIAEGHRRVTWTVEIAGPAAVEEVTLLHRRAAQVGFAHIFPPEAPPPPFEDDLARWAFWLGPDREQGRHAFAVPHDGRIVGIVLAGPDPDDGTLGHVARLYVEPDHWGHGIGRLLHDAAVADLRASGFHAATLWVLEDNHRARRWYERLGWRQAPGRKPTYEPAGIYDARYLLELGNVTGRRKELRG